MESHHHFWLFFWAILNNWAGYSTGGLIVALASLWFSGRGKTMSAKVFVGLSVCFFAMAIYKGWEDQYEKASEAGKSSDEFRSIANKYRDRFDNLSDALSIANATNKSLTEKIAKYNNQSPTLQNVQASNIVLNTDYSVGKQTIENSPSAINTIGQTGGTNTLFISNPLTLPKITSIHLDFLSITDSIDGIRLAYKTQFSVQINNCQNDTKLNFEKLPTNIIKREMVPVSPAFGFSASSAAPINFATAQITFWTSEKVSGSDFGKISIASP
jgi:hypothetical protein